MPLVYRVVLFLVVLIAGIVVGNAGLIVASPSKLTFIAEPGQNAPPQSLVVTNGEGGILDPEASASTTRGGEWLLVAKPPGFSEPTVFKVAALSSALAAGTYHGVITIASRFASNSPQEVPVELTVGAPGPGPTIGLSTRTLAFVTEVGRNPDPQTFLISNSQTGTLVWQGTVNTAGGNWLTLSPTGGTAPSTVTVSVNSANLQPGAYDGTISIASSSAGISNSPQSVAVSLTVRAANPIIALVPNRLTFTSDQGSSPGPQTFTVNNSGGGTLAWTVTVTSTGGGWLTVTPSSGAAPTTVQVTVNSSSLAPGTYAGGIIIASSSAGINNSPQTVSVSLTVRSVPPVITLSASSLTFSALPGAGLPPPQSVSLTNAGREPLNWAATVTTASGGDWLSVTPTTGTAPSTLTVAINPRLLVSGRYTGSISIRSTGVPASNTPQTILVELIVSMPRIASSGIVNAASGGTHGLSPGTIITLFGSNLAIAPQSATPGDFLPEELGGTTVRIGAFRARLLFVSPTQINAQVPVELTDATAPVRVSVGGLETDSVTLRVLPFDPGLFTFTGEPGGPVAALRASDYSPITASLPARRGSVIILYATGLGPVVPSVASGQFGSAREPLNRTVETPVAQIGERRARVLFSGLAPNFVGLYQVNIEIPLDAPTGETVPLILISGGRGSNTARLTVR